MKISYPLLILLLVAPTLVSAGGMNDDPVLTMLTLDQLEIRHADGDNHLVWDAEGWVGKDLRKFWFKTDGEYANGQLEDTELQLFYSRAIAPFWDRQMGWRRDIRPTSQRDWLTLGVKGLAPYHFDIDSAVFVGESGRTAARLRAEYEVLLTQHLILVPDVEMNLHGKNDSRTGTGSGLSNLEAGLRLGYELQREFVPYIGITWGRLYG